MEPQSFLQGVAAMKALGASLKKENYRVFDVRDVKVRFHGRRWRW